MSHHLENLESILRLELIHRFTGRPPPCDERILFALPARLGGLGLRNPAESAHNEFQSSRMVTDPLKKLNLTKNSDYSTPSNASQPNSRPSSKLKNSMSKRLKMWPRNSRPDCQSHPGRLWILQVNEEHPLGSPHYQYVSLVFAFTKVPLWTLFPYDMAGTPFNSHSLCLWLKLLGSTCSFLSKRRLPNYPP